MTTFSSQRVKSKCDSCSMKLRSLWLKNATILLDWQWLQGALTLKVYTFSEKDLNWFQNQCKYLENVRHSGKHVN